MMNDRSTRTDWFILIALVIAASLVVVLTRELRAVQVAAAEQTIQLESLERTLSRNIETSALERSILPRSVTEELLSLQQLQEGNAARTLLIAYTPEVCRTCLNSGLQSLQAWKPKGTVVRVLIGEATLRDRERALLLRADGLMPFSAVFAPATEVKSSLYPHLGGEHAEEPIYLLLDERFQIQSAFQADQRRPELLDQWLEVIR